MTNHCVTQVLLGVGGASTRRRIGYYNTMISFTNHAKRTRDSTRHFLHNKPSVISLLVFSFKYDSSPHNFAH